MTASEESYERQDMVLLLLLAIAILGVGGRPFERDLRVASRTLRTAYRPTAEFGPSDESSPTGKPPRPRSLRDDVLH